MSKHRSRLRLWTKDVQLSVRIGFPIYNNPGELKADVVALLEELTRTEIDRDSWRENAIIRNQEMWKLHQYVVAIPDVMAALHEIVQHGTSPDGVDANYQAVTAERALAALAGEQAVK